MTHQKINFLGSTGLAAILLGIAAITPAVADPAAIIITTPSNSEVASLEEIARDAELADGVLDVLLLENIRETGGKFRHLLAVTFRHDTYRQAWNPALGATEVAAVSLRHADILTHGEIWPRDTSKAIFKVNDYQPIVSSGAYDAFADGYIRPLMEGQISADIMTRYTMFFEHGEGGTVWSVLEYVSENALNRAGKIKDGIRATLTETDASYREFHPKKDTLRADGGDTLAVAISR